MTIKVLLVEDSPIARTILKRLIESDPQLQVVGVATTGLEGLAMVPTLQPDVICTDLHMPRMGGLEFIKAVMAEFPRPILVISASVQDEDTKNAFELLDAGAIDLFPKPRTGLQGDYDKIKAALISKIRVLSGVKVFTQSRKTTHNPVKSATTAPPSNAAALIGRTASGTLGDTADNRFVVRRSIQAIAIGASTGGPQALTTVLSEFPKNWHTPIFCVQHISKGFLGGLLRWLEGHCNLPIRLAQTGELPEKGVIYFPPEDQHLTINGRGQFFNSNEPPIAGHRPAVDMTFRSMAAYYGNKGAGVLLTGMGRDGADGLLAMHQAGAYTIAQDEASSTVFGMPKEAIALGAAQKILGIDQIAPHLLAIIQPY